MGTTVPHYTIGGCYLATTRTKRKIGFWKVEEKKGLERERERESVKHVQRWKEIKRREGERKVTTDCKRDDSGVETR